VIIHTPSILYAALLGLLLIALSFNVVLARRRYHVRLGVGSEEGMQQAVRVQANFSEYVPLAAVLLVLAELSGMPIAGVHVAGILLVTSRLLHAWGLSHSPGRTFGRFYGTAGTWLVITCLSLWLLQSSIDFSRFPGSG
jgi:uncharacterized membrane protein YecN with MAPEG domain